MSEENFKPGEINDQPKISDQPEITETIEVSNDDIVPSPIDAPKEETVQTPYTNYYQDQNQQNTMGYGSQPAKSGNGFAITAMILGIVSLVMFCTCINFPIAIVAIVFGILHLVKRKEKKGMAIAGIITASISIVIGIVFWILLIFNASAYSMYTNDWNELFDEYYYSDEAAPFFEGDDTF